MTEMMRTNAFDDILSLREAMNQLLTESFVRPRALGLADQVAMDLYETEQEYVAEVVVPGLKADNFEITLHENTLRVQGKTSAEQRVEQAHYHLRERRFGAFDRVIRFPTTVNADQVQAHLSEGILTIRVPKAESAKPKRIEVNAVSVS